MPSFIFMLSALYMKVRNRSRSRIARESRQCRQRRDQKEWFSWKSRAMAIEEDPTRGSEPAGGAADFLLLCLSMIHFAGLESLTSCVTEKKRKQSNAIKIAGHTSIIPQQHAAKHGLLSKPRSLSCLSLSAMHILFYTPYPQVKSQHHICIINNNTNW